MDIEIVLGQIKSRQADPDYNLHTIEEICHNEKIVKPDKTIVVTPELSTVGYLHHDDVYELAEPIPEGPICQSLIKIAKQANCYLIAGLAEKASPGIFYNAAIFLGPTGYLGKSRKILLPNYSVFNERRYFRPSTNIDVITTPLGKFGIQICYDLFSPEITRAHAFLGAHTSICISASPGIRGKYFETMLPARAMENTINMIYVNQSGIQDDLVFWGGSEIRTATGRRLIKLRYDEPDFGIKTLKINTLNQARPFVPTLRDQPPWIYSRLKEIVDNF